MTKPYHMLIFAEPQVGIILQSGRHGLRLTRGLVVIRHADPTSVEEMVKV